MKPLLEAVIDVYFILKSKQKEPFALGFNCAASALLPIVVWWGCEILDLPPSAPEAFGLGEAGHTLSRLQQACMCQIDSKYTYCLRKVSVVCSHPLKLCCHPSSRSPCALSSRCLF